MPNLKHLDGFDADDNEKEEDDEDEDEDDIDDDNDDDLLDSEGGDGESELVLLSSIAPVTGESRTSAAPR